MSAQGPPSGGPSSLTSSDDLQWQLSYDRASVDRYLAEIGTERARLQAEIDEALARRDAARAAIVAREAAAQAELGALVLATQNELERIEAGHREVLDTIRRAAEAEAARVLAAAHREVEAMRNVTASLAGSARGRGAGSRPVGHVDPPPSDHPSVRGRADAG
jgi:type IV secretory pathway TrbL component